MSVRLLLRQNFSPMDLPMRRAQWCILFPVRYSSLIWCNLIAKFPYSHAPVLAQWCAEFSTSAWEGIWHSGWKFSTLTHIARHSLPCLQTSTGCGHCHPSMKISFHYTRSLPMLMRWTRHIAALNSLHRCSEFAQECAELGAQEIALNLLCLPYNHILLTFFSYLENLVDLFWQLGKLCWPFFLHLV